MAEFPPPDDGMSEAKRKKAEAMRKLLHEPHRLEAEYHKRRRDNDPSLSKKTTVEHYREEGLARANERIEKIRNIRAVLHKPAQLEAEYHERRRSDDSSLPEDITVDQYREDRLAEPVDTDVPAENVSRFKSFMRGAMEKFGFGKEGTAKDFEAASAFLAERDAASVEKANGLWPGAEKAIRALGAKYNKLNWKYKIAIGAGLAGVAFGGAALTGGSVLLWSAGVSGWWRVLAGSGVFVGLEGYLQHKHEQKDGSRWWNKYPKAYAATAGLLIGGGSYLVAGGEAVAHSEWLADMLGHGSDTAPLAAPVAAAAQKAGEPFIPFRLDDAGMPDTHIDLSAHAGSAVEAPAVEQAASATPVAEHGVMPTPRPEVDAAHHAAHHLHHAGLSVEAREKLETAFLNKWQVDNPGTMPTHEQVQAYISEHSPHAAAAPETPHTTSAHEQLKELKARLGITEEQQTAELNRMSYESAHTINEQAAQYAAAPGIESAPAPEASSPLPPLEAYHGGETIQPYPVPPGAEHTAPGAEAAPSLGHLASAAEYAKAHVSEAHIYGSSRAHEFFAYGSTQQEQATAALRFFADQHHAKDVVYGVARDTKGVLHQIPYRFINGKLVVGLPLQKDTGPFNLWAIFRSIFGGSGLKSAPSLDDLKTLVQ